jgi:RNA polymerase sigma-70 factor, ECF subfamily
MTMAPGEITGLLVKMRQGDRQAERQLWDRLYPELHRLAEGSCRNERDGHTLSPTALVNEAYLELVEQSEKQWQNRVHFVAVAAQVMRRVLVDYARIHQAAKRGGGSGNRQFSFNEELMLIPQRADQVIALDEALGRLAAFDPQQSRIVELRFFGGLSERETAELLGLGVRTVTRGWNMAKAWLYSQLKA